MSLLSYCFGLVPILRAPFLADYYASIKWIFLYGSAIALMLSRRVPLLRLQATHKIGLALLVASMVFAKGNSRDAFLLLICLAVLSLEVRRGLLEGNGLLDKIGRANCLAAIAVLSFGVCEMLGLETSPHSIFPVSTFGYPNITAEFLGLSILLQIALSGNLPLLMACLSYFYLLDSRTNMIALGLSVMAFTFLSHKKERALLLKKAFLCGVFGFAIVYAAHLHDPDAIHLPAFNSFISMAKQKTLFLRLHRWANTIAMIKQNPAGVGFGNFEFSYLPYRNAVFNDPEIGENILAKTPHNDFLRAFAEGGLFFGFSVILLFIIFMQQLLSFPREKSKLAIALMAYLSVDAMSDFPFYNPYPFLCACLVLGIFLNLKYKENLSLSRRKTFWISAPLIIFAVYCTGTYLFSEFVEPGNEKKPEVAALACTLYPANWRVCVQAAYLETQSGQYFKGRHILEDVLKKNPNNFIATRVLYEVLLAGGLNIEACNTVARYNKILPEENDLTFTWLKDCRQND
jgi:hypothetical protein